jgi:hypothetical protein
VTEGTTDESEKEYAQRKMKEYADRVIFEETAAILKMAWSYMVFSQGPTTDKDYKKEHIVLWEKMTGLLNSKVRGDMLTQCIAHRFPNWGQEVCAKVHRPRLLAPTKLLLAVRITIPSV